ncbi:MAG: hypothetical protein AAGA48_02080 [Myxococcota bacterium]
MTADVFTKCARWSLEEKEFRWLGLSPEGVSVSSIDDKCKEQEASDAGCVRDDQDLNWPVGGRETVLQHAATQPSIQQPGFS